MSAEELIAKYPADTIKVAAELIKVKEDMQHKLKDSRWANVPLILKKETCVIPPLDENRRPLAVTMHCYGLYIEPIYTAYKGGKPDTDFVLYVDEQGEGIYIHVEDAFGLMFSGSREKGFRLEVTECDKNTKIIDTTPKYRSDKP